MGICMVNETSETKDDYEGPYDRMWWEEDLTEEEKRLFPKKHFHELPGASLPDGVVLEKDVPVEMSDGLKLAANVFRPDKEGKFPVILTYTPFSKDYYGQHAPIGVSENTAFEAPDPGFWVPNDYVMILFDQRGTGRSPSGGTGGAYDYHDGIEWAGTQEWSNGNVGMFGHSALAMCQWEVAAMEDPPDHLEAIIPWGGFTDMLRDCFRPGGIPQTRFDASRGENLPLWQEDFDPEERPPLPSTFSADYGGAEESPKLENITAPMLLGSTWADTEFHLRGNFRAWRKVSTPPEDKWLYTYAKRKWNGVYTPAEAREIQLRFANHYLKGEESGIKEVPRVRLAVRDSLFDTSVRYEHEWPIDRTEYTKLYLHADDGALSIERPEQESTVTYDSEADDGKAIFDITFDGETELTGHSKLKVWVSPEDTDDMDLFVTLRKLNANGDVVGFKSDYAPGKLPVDQGWMRVSKRELDEEQSEFWLPVQKSVAPNGPEQKVEPGEIVPVQIQLVGTSTIFHSGETLRLEIAGKHGVENDLMMAYDDLVNQGDHTIITGGNRASYLQVPEVPEADQYEMYTFSPRKVPTEK